MAYVICNVVFSGLLETKIFRWLNRQAFNPISNDENEKQLQCDEIRICIRNISPKLFENSAKTLSSVVFFIIPIVVLFLFFGLCVCGDIMICQTKKFDLIFELHFWHKILLRFSILEWILATLLLTRTGELSSFFSCRCWCGVFVTSYRFYIV